MKKRKSTGLILIAVVVILFMVWFLGISSGKLLNMNPSDVSQITIDRGVSSYTITDQKEIEKTLQLLQSMKFRRAFPHNKDGMIASLDIYVKNEDKVCNVTILGNDITIDHKNYKPVKDYSEAFVKLFADLEQSDASEIGSTTTGMISSENTEAVISDYSSEDLHEKLETYKTNDTVAYVGKNVIISKNEIEQYQSVYEEQGIAANEAEEKAVSYAKQRNALYAAAMNQGFYVTDQELNDYLKELKQSLEEDTSGVYQEAMKDFDSEDAYWAYEYQVYQMNLPIQKYVQYCEQQYAKNQDLEAGTSGFDEKWSVEFERLKEQLVMEQDFVAVSSER